MLKRFAGILFALNSVIFFPWFFQESNFQNPKNYPSMPECNGSQGENFLYNGDFGAGEANIYPEDPGLSPSYPYSFTGPPDLGTYTLTNNTTDWDGVADNWIDIQDNSSDSNGYMMVVDAALEPGIFYEHVIDVCANTTYEFSADIINIVEPASSPLLLPNVDFLIDGNGVLNTGDIPQDATWYNYGFLFTTGANQFTLTLALRNNASGDAGNDLALDNIAFRTCGPEVTANLLTTDPICPGDSVTVNLEIGPEYPTPFIQWQVLDQTGADWRDIGEATDQLTVNLGPIPAAGILRALVVNSPDNLLNNYLCAVISNEINPDFLPVEDCFTSPIMVTGELCEGTLGENIFPEGDFGSGSDQFGPPLPEGTTTYILQDTTWPNDGFYSILNFWGTDPCEGFFAEPCWIIPLEDNSDDPEGYVMAVNATWGETGIFYYSTISGLCENTTYQFSADIKNLNNLFFAPYTPDSPDEVILPNIDFIIGPEDAPLELLQVAPESYNTGDIINDGQWITYGFTFQTAPGITDITFAIRNNAPGGGGNDILLDNISFRICGPDLSLFRPEICEGESVTLSAVIVGEQFDEPSIQWQESTDMGTSWTDLPGQTNTALLLASPVEGNQYRFKVAGSIENLSNPNCFLLSPIDTIIIHSGSTTPLAAAICEGDSYSVGPETFNQSGNYTVTLTSAAGCDSTIMLSLTVTEVFEISLVENICEGETYTLGTNEYTETGIYSDSLITEVGCDSIIYLNLTVNPAYDLEVNDTICEGEIYIVGTSFYAQTGIYSNLLQTEEGCDSMINLVLTVRPSPVTLLTESICEGESFSVGLSTYTESGNYTDVLSTLYGCDSTILLNLTVLDSVVTRQEIGLCMGDTYEGVPVTADSLITELLTAANGCDSTAITFLNVSDLDAISISGSTTFCAGGFSLISAPEGFSSYAWSNGDNTALIEADEPGLYSVTVTDEIGCQAEASINLEALEISASFSTVNPSCFGIADGAILVDEIVGATGSVVVLINGVESPLVGLAADTFEITIIDERSCHYTESISLSNPSLLTITQETQLEIKISDSIELQPQFNFTPDSLVWTPAEGLSCTNCPNPIASPVATTTYRLTAWDEKGCFVISEIQILVSNRRDVYIPNAFSPNNDGINDEFTVFGGEAIEIIEQLAIFDRWGELVFDAADFAPNDLKLGWNGDFLGKPMQSGVYVYFAKVRFKDGSSVIYKGDVLLLR